MSLALHDPWLARLVLGQSWQLRFLGWVESKLRILHKSLEVAGGFGVLFWRLRLGAMTKAPKAENIWKNR